MLPTSPFPMSPQLLPLPRIIIAEDEPAIAMDLETSLREAGYEPVGPATTRPELDALVAAPDLSGAVLDVGLLGPEPKDGLRPLLMREVPVIFLTGYDHDEDLDQMPCSAFIAKPVAMASVVDCLDGLLATRARQGFMWLGARPAPTRTKSASLFAALTLSSFSGGRPR
jgi:DNA-binding response OmpR family regulator